MAKPEEKNMETSAPVEKSRKDSYMEGFRKKHPDWKDDDEEGFYGALSDDEAAWDNERKSWDEERTGFENREKEVSDALSKGGVLNAALFSELLSGTPIPLALIKRYPEEIKSWLDDPENTDALEKTFTEHANNIKKDEELDAEASKNLEETNAMIDEMIASGEIKDEEEVNSLLEFLGTIATGLMMNHVEKEWLIAAKNAINHDADVDAARTEGEIEGRNQKITAQRSASQRGGNTHAGLGSGNAGQKLSRKETQQATGNNVGRKDMWAGMKTNKLN